MSEEDFSTMRAAMVSGQLRTNAVTNAGVLKAMETVERQDFVPVDRAALAYVDVPVPLGRGRSLNAPLTTGRLLCEASPTQGQSVLLIGGATGYSVALLADMGVTVVAVEEDEALLATLSSRFAGKPGITIIAGPLTAGHADGSPYDTIIIDGAIEQVPQALWHQVRDGGTIVAGMIDRGVTRLSSGRKSGASGVMRPFLDVDAAHLPGFSSATGFQF
jgi:protein-L-isoaspartate(D-aspartate) O-methyltransferase